MAVIFFVLSTLAIICLIGLIAEKPKETDYQEINSAQTQANSYIQARRIDEAGTTGRARTIGTPIENRMGPRVIRKERSQNKIKVISKDRQDRKCFYCGHTNKMVYKQYECEHCNSKNGTDKEVFRTFN